MTLPASLAPFSKAKHYNETFVNGAGNRVPVRFTVLSKISEDGNFVDYAVAWCATTEKVFRKKDGVAIAKTKPVYRVELSDRDDRHAHYMIEHAILEDLHENHWDEIPYACRPYIAFEARFAFGFPCA